MNYDKQLEELLDSYYNAIINLTDEESIHSALPRPGFDNFLTIMKGLIRKFKETIEEYQLLLNNSNDESESNYITGEIELIKRKIEFCEELCVEANIDKQIEVQSKNIPVKHLVFATTDFDNPYVFNDLKTIPEEYYPEIMECFERIINGEKENNSNKAKVLVSNNKLQGVHEIKAFKLRIIYKFLAPDMVYIMQIKTKKSNNKKNDKGKIEDRTKLTVKEFNELKKQARDMNVKSKMIEEGDAIWHSLKDLLTTNGRGVKK